MTNLLSASGASRGVQAFVLQSHNLCEPEPLRLRQESAITFLQVLFRRHAMLLKPLCKLDSTTSVSRLLLDKLQPAFRGNGTGRASEGVAAKAKATKTLCTLSLFFRRARRPPGRSPLRVGICPPKIKQTTISEVP
jgi:hypothetical protein